MLVINNTFKNIVTYVQFTYDLLDNCIPIFCYWIIVLLYFYIFSDRCYFLCCINMLNMKNL